MDMTTREATVAATRQKFGIDVITVQPGQSLKIETSPNGEEVLDVMCPQGSTWTVQISVIVNELDD